MHNGLSPKVDFLGRKQQFVFVQGIQLDHRLLKRQSSWCRRPQRFVETNSLRPTPVKSRFEKLVKARKERSCADSRTMELQRIQDSQKTCHASEMLSVTRFKILQDSHFRSRGRRHWLAIV